MYTVYTTFALDNDHLPKMTTYSVTYSSVKSVKQNTKTRLSNLECTRPHVNLISWVSFCGEGFGTGSKQLVEGAASNQAEKNRYTYLLNIQLLFDDVPFQ